MGFSEAEGSLSVIRDDTPNKKDKGIEGQLLHDIWQGKPSSLLEVIKCMNEKILVMILRNENTPITPEMTNYKDHRGQSCLHWAVHVQNPSWIKLLLEKGAEPDVKDLTGRAPLHVACLNGDTFAIELLLHYNGSIHLRDNEQRTALHWACYDGSLEAVVCIIKRGGKIEVKDSHGLTPLHMACFNGHHKVVEFLLKPIIDKKRLKGANANTQDNQGRTSLHAAAFCGVNEDFVTLIEHIILANGDINIIDENGRNCLFWCILGGCHTGVIKLLIDCGIHLHVADKFGRQVVHYTAYFNRKKAILLLGDNGVDIQVKDFDQQTPLHAAVKWDDLVKLFIRSSVDLQVKNNDKQTPLHVAMMGGYTESFLHLLNASPDFSIQSQDIFGRNLFHYAAWSNALDCVEFLTGLGCNMFHCDNSQRNVLHFAARNGHLNFIRMVNDLCSPERFSALVCQEDKFGLTPLHYAAIESSDSVCRLLLSHNASVTAKDHKNRAPIHVAAYFGNLDALVVLIQEDKSPLRDSDSDGLKVIHLAAAGNSIHAFEMIATVGGSLFLKDDYGRSALFYVHSIEFASNLLLRGFELTEKDQNNRNMLFEAVAMNRFELVQWLVNDKGMGVDIRDSLSISLLHVAARVGNVEMLRFLSSKGTVNMACQDNDGRTILHYASACGSLPCVRFLCELDSVRVDQRDLKGRSALDTAAFFGHVGVVEYLISKYNKQTSIPLAKDGRTPLLAAVYSLRNQPEPNLRLLEILLDKFDINMVDDKKRSALYRAAFFKNPTIIRFLIERGARVDLPDYRGVTPAMVAASRGAVDCIELLETKETRSLIDKNNRTAEDYWKRYHKRKGISPCPVYPIGIQTSEALLDELTDELEDWVTFDSPKGHDKSPAVQNEDVSKYLARIKQLEAEVQTLGERNKLLQEVYSEAEENLELSNDQLESTCSTYEERLRKKDEEIEKYKREVEELRKEKETHSANQSIIINDLRAKLEQSSAKLESSEKRLQELTEKNEYLQANEDNLSGELSKLKGQHQKELNFMKERLFGVLVLSIKCSMLSENTLKNESFVMQTSIPDLWELVQNEDAPMETWDRFIRKEINRGIVRNQTLSKQSNKE